MAASASAMATAASGMAAAKASSTMHASAKASSMAAAAKASSMAAAAKAGLSSGGVASGLASVAESTEGAGMRSSLCMRAAALKSSMLPAKIIAVDIAAMTEVSSMVEAATIEVPSVRIKIIAIDDGPAMRDERVVVEDDSPAAAPIEIPMVKTPAEAGEKPNPEAQSKTYSRSVQEKSRIRIPTGEYSQRGSVCQPWIILRDVNHLG